jgi:hypothetical protein
MKKQKRGSWLRLQLGINLRGKVCCNLLRGTASKKVQLLFIDNTKETHTWKW